MRHPLPDGPGDPNPPDSWYQPDDELMDDEEENNMTTDTVQRQVAIWKFRLDIDDYIDVEMPKGARILTVQMMGQIPYLWVIIDDSEPMEIRRFRIARTGHPISESELSYVGTIQHIGLVFHVFELARSGS